MNLNCVIVDDDHLSVEVLKKYSAQVNFLSVQQTFNTPEEALTWLKENKTDILFLDIEMPRLNDFEVLNGLEYPPVVILTTAYQNFAVKAFDLEILDYLLKPIEFEHFEKAVKRAAVYIEIHADHKAKQKKNYLTVKSDYKLNKIPFDSIQYIEGLGEYVKIHTPGKTHITVAAIKDLEQNLPVENFVRIHKSYIVSIKSIITYNKQQVRMMGNVKLPVGRVFKSGFIKAIK
jgi:DNA-binding LytR/AlgR family response regulator